MLAHTYNFRVGKPEAVDYCKFEANLVYTVSSRPFWATKWGSAWGNNSCVASLGGLRLRPGVCCLRSRPLPVPWCVLDLQGLMRDSGLLCVKEQGKETVVTIFQILIRFLSSYSIAFARHSDVCNVSSGLAQRHLLQGTGKFLAPHWSRISVGET